MSIDTFENTAPSLSSPAIGIEDIIPSDTADLAVMTRALNVGQSGTIRVATQDGTIADLFVAAGIPFRCGCAGFMQPAPRRATFAGCTKHPPTRRWWQRFWGRWRCHRPFFFAPSSFSGRANGKEPGPENADAAITQAI